jgi:hypothetical protein
LAEAEPEYRGNKNGVGAWREVPTVVDRAEQATAGSELIEKKEWRRWSWGKDNS